MRTIGEKVLPSTLFLRFSPPGPGGGACGGRLAGRSRAATGVAEAGGDQRRGVPDRDFPAEIPTRGASTRVSARATAAAAAKEGLADERSENCEVAVEEPGPGRLCRCSGLVGRLFDRRRFARHGVDVGLPLLLVPARRSRCLLGLGFGPCSAAIHRRIWRW